MCPRLVGRKKLREKLKTLDRRCTMSQDVLKECMEQMQAFLEWSETHQGATLRAWKSSWNAPCKGYGSV